ncbi:MAG: hypothetical protein LBR54_03905 [Oscillospiraceae bacterium]|nr:hypothetical protein [Oscillospiraceae bacterium]
MKIRIAILVVIVLTAMALCGLTLMKIQIVEGGVSAYDVRTPRISKQTVRATRGEIVDKNFEKIVGNTPYYDAVLEKAYFPSDKRQGNEILLKCVSLLEEHGKEYNETVPITSGKPYEFLPDKDNEIAVLKKNLGLQPYATAENCMDKLFEDYDITGYSERESRILAGIRYEMLLKGFSLETKFTFASDIPQELMLLIKESRLELKGLNVEETSKRGYAQVDILPHEIGTVGPIYAEEYEKLKSEGYALSDTVGKSGIESAMEKYLRGENGILETSVLGDVIVSSETSKECIPGNSVKLTIDSRFQKDVQNVLAEYLEKTGVQCGAIAVLDVKTGAVLALATMPTYTVTEYTENYAGILERENNPLVNRATNGLYRPGSTFKPITATAGLNEGVVNPSTVFNCTQTYNFLDITVRCTGLHGSISAANAIGVSCNIYFYELGRRLGIDRIAQYAKLYGYGESLGLETGDLAGYVASPETFKNLNLEWTSGQVLQAAIGQSEIAVTPLQMASAAMTVANKGKRYRPYLVDSIYDYTLTNQLHKTEPEIAAEIEPKNPGVYDTIEQGMIQAAANTPAGEYSLNGLGYQVAIKTGTPQQTATVTNSAFIGYAPVGDPQIAFAGIVEKGENSKYMIRKILDAYYSNR